ncbi:DUF2378 family protein [Archangium violaceum]|uniref:Myxococcales-restricted protein, TIGR02265 family n=1 Tax=Archangium violaceum Cb vi76 TaxID=1406225 RepID=A0A084SPR9_9BACT|nr:DUF2378 family protein [Archangium violaceum]KFA90454.1 hypothetical protein Q664_28345 [Archangium violaceum Cb vi76]
MPLPSSIPAPGLEHLLSLATPADTARGMFFNGLFDATRALGGEEARTKCLAAAGDRKFVDFRSYPVADLLKAIYTAADTLGPKLGGREAVLHRLGRRATEDFLHSTVGKTMVALAGNDPHRLLSAFPNACRAALSYGERSVERIGDKQVRLLARRDFLPMNYVEGTLTAVVERSAVPGVMVRGLRLSPLDVDYDISWS